MTVAVVPPAGANQMVGMGQIAIGEGKGCLTAVLGSCIGVALHQPRLRLSALAHVVLPRASGRDSSAGKFADTAIPYMIAELERRGAKANGLTVKLVGGACMFKASGPLQIGEANAKAVMEALTANGLSVAAHDLGGTAGRRISLDCATGQLTVECIGRSPLIL